MRSENPVIPDGNSVNIFLKSDLKAANCVDCKGSPIDLNNVVVAYGLLSFFERISKCPMTNGKTAAVAAAKKIRA
jgi:hypothetical protein